MNSKLTGEGDEDADVLKKWPKMIKNQELLHRGLHQLLGRSGTGTLLLIPILMLYTQKISESQTGAALGTNKVFQVV